jgi:hypothetical protein
MTDRFLELCAREFAAHVQRMFDNAPRIPGTGMAEIPVVGGLLLLGMPVPPCLYERVYMALGARERFHQDKPAWAPELPLHGDAIAAMKNDDVPGIAVVGLYADSLAAEYRWDYCWRAGMPRTRFAPPARCCRNSHRVRSQDCAMGTCTGAHPQR